MDADPPKSGDNEGDDKTPQKKMKLDDQQQPSTSSSSGSSSMSSARFSIYAVPSDSNISESETSQQNLEIGAADPPNAPPDEPANLREELFNDAGIEPPRRRVLRNDHDYHAEGARSENVLRSRGYRRARVGQEPALPSQNQQDDQEANNDPSRQPRSVSPMLISLHRELSAMRERMAARYAANLPEGGNENYGDGERRRRNRANEGIAFVLSPNRFAGYESSSEDGTDPAADDAEDEIEPTENEYEIDDDSDDSITSMSASSSNNHSSTISSNSDSSLSLPRADYDVDIDIDYVMPRRERLDLDVLISLKTDQVKCDWNVAGGLMRRQHGLRFNPGEKYHPSQFQNRAYGSVQLVQRMGLLHKLVNHTGCVNSLSFHPNGQLLASGSDDLRINLWNWDRKQLVASIRSGHKNNVFQTKFMSGDGYAGEYDIISTGRDGHVRHTVVDPAGHPFVKLIFKANRPIHKVAVPARDENTFLTAGEDSKVRLCDLRTDKVQTLVEVRRRLYSIATHPYDQEFCVSGSDSAVHVYDLRRSNKPIRLLYSHRAEAEKSHHERRGSVTCAVYNHDGSEILASYSDDDIYLFNNNAPESALFPISRFQGHRNIQTIKGVNFFGPNSEYVVSGSDCGYIYIWEKRSKIIVNWLKSNPGGVVNCLEPHPAFPIMATSGVDDDIKIWAPKGLKDGQSAPVFSRQDIKRYVRRNINGRNPFRDLAGLRSPAITQFFTANAIARRRMDEVRSVSDVATAANEAADRIENVLGNRNPRVDDDDSDVNVQSFLRSCNQS